MGLIGEGQSITLMKISPDKEKNRRRKIQGDPKVAQ